MSAKMSTKDTMAEQESNGDVTTKPKSCLGIRHFQVLMMSLGMLLVFCVRVCMSIAIVAMTDLSKNHTFNWTLPTQGLVLSSFNWGYILLQIPGGELAARYGGMPLFASTLCINSVVSLLIPVAAYHGGWQAVCVCRIAQGMAQGFVNPALHQLISKWVPPDERSRLGSIIYSGSMLGTAIELVSAGFIADYWGWPTIFYIAGTLGVLWTAAFILLGANSPEESKLISLEEQLYIQKSLGQRQVEKNKKLKTPWKCLLTSMPLYALVAAHAGSGFGYWTLLNVVPTYQHKVIGVNIKSNGMMAALPYLFGYLSSFIFGFSSDYILKKKWLSLTATRKLSNSIAMYGPAASLIAISYITPSVTVALVLFTVSFGLKTGTLTGYNLVHLDMAPNFASTMIGISGTITNLVALNAALVAGVLVQDDESPSEWRKVFLFASVVYIATNTFFLIFGTSERQPWNDKDVKQPLDKVPEDNVTDKILVSTEK